jgi:hypothetical protein
VWLWGGGCFAYGRWASLGLSACVALSVCVFMVLAFPFFLGSLLASTSGHYAAAKKGAIVRAFFVRA